MAQKVTLQVVLRKKEETRIEEVMADVVHTVRKLGTRLKGALN